MKRKIQMLAMVLGLAAVCCFAAPSSWRPAMLGVIAAISLALTVETELDWRAADTGYRELFNKHPQPMWVYEFETLRFLAVNEAALEHYGYTLEEFLKLRIDDIRPKEDVTANFLLSSSADPAPGLPREWLHRRNDGTVFAVETTRQNVIFEGRRAVLALSQDITERKRAEKRLKAFANLGRRLSAARSPHEAAQILMDTADELFGWDACTFDLCSPDQDRISAVLYIDTIGGRRVDVSAQRVA